MKRILALVTVLLTAGLVLVGAQPASAAPVQTAAPCVPTNLRICVRPVQARCLPTVLRICVRPLWSRPVILYSVVRPNATLR